MQSEIDTMLAQSEQKIAALKDDLRLEERLRDRILELRQQRPVVVSQAAQPIDHNSGENGGSRPLGTVIARTLMSHVVAVLEEAGHSLKAREISNRVMARGYTTNAKGGVPVAVSTTLAHDDGKVFKKVDYGVYDLKSRQEATPLLEAGSN